MERTPRDDGTPLHVQLRESIIQAIIVGSWAPGVRIPSERELCRQYGVSRTTTRRTISECVHDGWLYTVVGKGTYVATNRLEQELRSLTGFSDDLRKRGIAASSRVLAAEGVKAPADLATSLGLLTEAPVLRLQRIRFASAKPIAVQTTWLPEHLCPGLFRFDFTTHSLYGVLREEYGLRLVRGETKIKAGLATPFERRALRLVDPSAVLRTTQVTYLDDGQPIEYCESVFHGELYELTFAATS
jgi:GntR family transcriptional regulator